MQGQPGASGLAGKEMEVSVAQAKFRALVCREGSR